MNTLIETPTQEQIIDTTEENINDKINKLLTNCVKLELRLLEKTKKCSFTSKKTGKYNLQFTYKPELTFNEFGEEYEYERTEDKVLSESVLDTIINIVGKPIMLRQIVIL